jgi:peptide/nickel transport system substrate-binding protein
MGRNLIRTAAAAVLVFAVAAAGGKALAQSSGADATGQDVVLRVGTTADLTTPNIWGVNAGSDWAVATIQYDLMLKFSSDDASAAPNLATGCDPSADFMTYTCHIRDDLMWSDGEEMTSRDIAFTYEFIAKHKIPQYRADLDLAYEPTWETPDDTTLIWRSTQPTSAPLRPPWIYIVPEHIWGEYMDAPDLRTIKQVDTVPGIGSGPYTITDWNRGQGFTLERNPYFWGGDLAIDRIEYTVYSNQEALILALKNNEIDFADGLKATLFQSLEGAENIVTHSTVSDWWLNLAFNFGGQGPAADPLPALQDHDLRLAMAMAIDKSAIAQKVYLGTADPGDTIIRPASAFWHLDIPAEDEIPFDPEGAMDLLDQAGYVDTDGDGVREDPRTGDPLRLRMPASTDTIGATDAGKFIVDYLGNVGIAVDMIPANDSLMDDYWGKGNFDAYIWYWSGNPDPDYQLDVFTSSQCGSWSDGCWSDPHFDALYDQQKAIMDPDERQAVVFEAQQYEYDQIPGLVLAYPGWLQAYRSDRFEGYVPHPGPDGYLMPTYNYDTLLSLHPVSAEAATTPPSVGVPGWIWAVAGLAVVVIVVGLVLRGRRRAIDEA